MRIEEQLGKTIRHTRISKGWTLSDLSKKAKLSVSTLSKIENAQVSSPVAVYANIAAALRLHLGELFYFDKHVPLSFVKKNEWKTVTKVPNYIGKAIAYKKSNKKMEPFINIYHPKIVNPPRYKHENEEFIFVLKGRLEFNYGESKYILNEGDCVYYDARIEHCTVALDNQEGRALVVQV
jgi:transcriptional regulator with XRE-family HTH domain